MGLVVGMSEDWLCEFDVLDGSCKFLLVVSKRRIVTILGYILPW